MPLIFNKLKYSKMQAGSGPSKHKKAKLTEAKKVVTEAKIDLV